MDQVASHSSSAIGGQKGISPADGGRAALVVAHPGHELRAHVGAARARGGRFGEQPVADHRYSHPIRFREHILPIEEVLSALTAVTARP